MTRIIETYSVFLSIGVHKPSGLIQLRNVVTVETVKWWSISVKYYIVWLFTKIGRIKPVYEVVGCLSL